MRNDINSDACRICLRKSSTCRTIFKPLDENDIAPNIKLNLVSGVNVNEKDQVPGLPQYICKQCEISLNMAYTLRQRARRSDQILSVYCNKIYKDNIIVELADGRKYKLNKELTLKVVKKNESPTLLSSETLGKSEIQFENDSDDDDDDADVDLDDNVIEVNEDEEPVEELDEEHDDDLNIDEDIKSNSDNTENDRDVFSENEKDCKDNGKESSNLEKLEIRYIEEAKPIHKRQLTYNGEEIAEKLKASSQYELVSWKQEDDVNAVPTFKLRLKEPEEKHTSKDFICEVCANTYSQKHRLMEHMRRHNPEKIYACEFCGKRFAVSEGLRRHVLTHGALKPYKCNQCTRCFYTPSARKAHEKVHSGYKPYVCNICTKAFAYTGSLRKHMLIHENKKFYRCDYCDKEFRLQHHMKQHEETQIHKDAVAELTKSAESKLQT